MVEITDSEYMDAESRLHLLAKIGRSIFKYLEKNKRSRDQLSLRGLVVESQSPPKPQPQSAQLKLQSRQIGLSSPQ